MFAMLTIERKAAKNIFARLRLLLAVRSCVTVSAISAEGTIIYHVALQLPRRIGAKTEKRRIRRALSKIRGLGLHRVIVPDEAKEFLNEYGLAPVALQYSMSTCAAQGVLLLARKMRFEPSRLCVILCAKKLTVAVRAAMLTLAPKVRTIRLSIQGGSAEAERILMENYGIASNGELPAHTRAIAVMFDGGMEIPQCDRALDISGTYACSEKIICPKLKAPSETDQKRPQDIPRDLFAAALHSCCAMSAQRLIIQIDEKSALTE